MGRLESVADACGPPCRGNRRAAQDDGRPRPAMRSCRDPGGTAAIHERLAAPGELQNLNCFFEQPATLPDIDAEHGEFLRDITRGYDQVQAAAADQVDNGAILGHADRVVERDNEGADGDPDVARARSRRRRGNERRRQVAVRAPVVLEEADGVETQGVCPSALVERRRVELGGRRTPVGRPEIELQTEPHGGIPRSSGASNPTDCAVLALAGQAQRQSGGCTDPKYPDRSG